MDATQQQNDGQCHMWCGPLDGRIKKTTTKYDPDADFADQF